MGCSNSSAEVIMEIEDYKENERLKKLVINYILLRKQVLYEEKIIDENLYLVETDYFQKICDTINFDFNENEIKYNDNFNQKLLSEIFKLGNPKIKFIENKDDIKSTNSNIEIVTEKILYYLNIDEKEYKDKNIIYNKISEEEIEIIFKNRSKLKLSIIKEKIPFKIIKEEKMKSLNKIGLRKDLNESDLNKNEYIQIQEKDFSNKKLNISEDKNILATTDFTVVGNNKNILNCQSEPNILNTVIGNLNEHKRIINFRMFYDYYIKFFDDLNNMNNLISKHINSNDVYKDYVILSKRSYNILIKLFETDSKFFNENYIIDSFEKLRPMNNIDFNNLNIKNRWKTYIKNETFFKLDMEIIKNTRSKYPNNFILIKRELLEKYGFIYNEFKENSFDVFFGEDYLFIKISKKSLIKIIICSKDNFFFNTNLVLFCFQKNYFEKEVEPNIKNKDGFNDFFSKIGMDASKQSIYRHIIGEDVLSEIYIINYKHRKKEIKVNPLLKQIIISLYNIKELKENFGKYGSENSDIISLFIQFIHQFPFKYENGLIIINEIENIIKDNKVENNFINIIDFIFKCMYEILNGNIFGNKIDNYFNYGMEATDKNYVLDICKKNSNYNNKSIIKDLFYGIILKTTIPTCCSERYYKCKISKYVYFNYEEIKNYDDLTDIMEKWGNSKDNNYHCDGCFIESDADISETFEEHPKILIIILNDENEKNKKSIKFPIELNINKFSFTYKLLSVISTKSLDNNFELLKHENDNWVLVEDNEKNIGQKEVEIYSKYPRVFFYERNMEIRKSLEKSPTEIGVDNFFNQTPSSRNLKLDNTRIKNSIDYHNNYSIININNTNENELFMKNNINPYEPNLSQNNYPNNNININNHENQNLIQLNNFDNIQIPKEYIEKLGGINNINNLIYNKTNSNNVSEYYDDDNGKKDGNKDTIKKLKYNLNINNYNITNNIQIYPNYNQMNNNSNNNINYEKNSYNQSNGPINNQINQYNNYYPLNFNNNNNNSKNEKYLNPKFSYINSEKQSNISNILEKKEINLKFVHNGLEYSLAIYDENILFKDVILMLKEQIPDIQSDNYFFLTQGKKININKTIKENEIEDGFYILIYETD